MRSHCGFTWQRRCTTCIFRGINERLIAGSSSTALFGVARLNRLLGGLVFVSIVIFVVVLSGGGGGADGGVGNSSSSGGGGRSDGGEFVGVANSYE